MGSWLKWGTLILFGKTTKRKDENLLKAMICTKYGSPDVLQLKEVETPVPDDNQLLVKVHASSVNALDWHFLSGKPFLVRLQYGLLKPKISILGYDISGRVVAVGKKVTLFQPGDEVFGGLGFGLGGFAEYVCIAEDGFVALKPSGTTFEEAASVPAAAVAALKGLRDKGHIQSGHKVLVNGAAGGVGTFSVQIAKSFDAAHVDPVHLGAEAFKDGRPTGCLCFERGTKQTGASLPEGAS